MSTPKSRAYFVSVCGVFLWETSDSSDFKIGNRFVLIGVGCGESGLSYSADFPLFMVLSLSCASYSMGMHFKMGIPRSTKSVCLVTRIWALRMKDFILLMNACAFSCLWLLLMALHPRPCFLSPPSLCHSY